MPSHNVIRTSQYFVRFTIYLIEPGTFRNVPISVELLDLTFYLFRPGTFANVTSYYVQRKTKYHVRFTIYCSLQSGTFGNVPISCTSQHFVRFAIYLACA